MSFKNALKGHKVGNLPDSEADYARATARYQAVREAEKGSLKQKEKQLLAFLIDHYEKEIWDMPAVDPIELIKIRMKEFGYKAADLAKQYGDKVTLGKLLNYKQALSLTMIRKFSKLLRIPIAALAKEYSLQ